MEVITLSPTGYMLGGFIGGIIVASVLWFFILRNNRKHIDTILDDPESILKYYNNKLNDYSTDLRNKITDVLNAIKDSKK